jgi:hypothetical protein
LAYIVRIWSFEYRRSISKATSASFTFRERVFCGVRKIARASCWVTVEPPCA